MIKRTRQLTRHKRLGRLTLAFLLPGLLLSLLAGLCAPSSAYVVNKTGDIVPGLLPTLGASSNTFTGDLFLANLTGTGSLTAPTLVGGTGASSTLTIKPTSNGSPSGAQTIIGNSTQFITKIGPSTSRFTLNPLSTDTAGAANSGGSPFLFDTTFSYPLTGSLDASRIHAEGLFVSGHYDVSLSDPSASISSFYALYNGKQGNSSVPIPAGTRGVPSNFEGNLNTAQNGADVLEAPHIFGGTGIGHGSAGLRGASITLEPDTTAQPVIVFNGHIANNAPAGSAQYGAYILADGSTDSSAGYYADGKFTYGFYARNNGTGSVGYICDSCGGYNDWNFASGSVIDHNNTNRHKDFWNSNTYQSLSDFTGTGTPPDYQIKVLGTGGNFITTTWQRHSFPFEEHTVPAATSGVMNQYDGAETASSGTQTTLNLAPTITQTGTASYSILRVNPSVASSGSGTHLLAELAVGGTDKFTVDDGGNASLGANPSLSGQIRMGNNQTISARSGANGSDVAIAYVDTTDRVRVKGTTDLSFSTAVEDEFLGGGTLTSGNIGSLGWTSVTVGSGTSLAQSVLIGHPGTLNFATGATSGSGRGLMLGATTSTYSLASDDNLDVSFYFRPNQIDANTIVLAGISSDPSSTAPTDGVYIEHQAADTDWECNVRVGGVDNRTDTLVAATANVWTKVRIRRTSATVWSCSVNGSVEVPDTASSASGTGLQPFILIQNNTTTNKTLDLDYAEIADVGLSRM